jgi:hypothetical protein
MVAGRRFIIIYTYISCLVVHAKECRQHPLVPNTETADRGKHLNTFISPSSINTINISDKIENIKNHILCSTDDNIIRRMRFACWIPKATDTNSEYVICMY